MARLYKIATINNLCFCLCRYLAPEYAEEGIVSVRTDVYAYGIVLLQLISGRKAINSNNSEQQQSLRQWVSSIIYVSFRYVENSSMSIKEHYLTRF